MSLFKKLKGGLEEAIEHERKPELSKARVRPRSLEIAPARRFTAEEVRKIRIGLRLSQEQFARLVAVSSETVAKWEQGENSPARSSNRLLEIFSASPDLASKLGFVREA